MTWHARGLIRKAGILCLDQPSPDTKCHNRIKGEENWAEVGGWPPTVSLAASNSALHHTRVTPESFTHRNLHAVEHNYVWIRIIPPLHARNSCLVMRSFSQQKSRDSLPDIPRAARGVTCLHACMPSTIHPCVQLISN